MKCPIDGSELAMMERQGIEVDYCPKCRGVWLDRGELDKIIERSGSAGSSAQPRSEEPRQQPEQPAYRDDRHFSTHRPYKKKKKSFLDDIFDF